MAAVSELHWQPAPQLERYQQRLSTDLTLLLSHHDFRLAVQHKRREWLVTLPRPSTANETESDSGIRVCYLGIAAIGQGTLKSSAWNCHQSKLALPSSPAGNSFINPGI
jgi:hypothetical protein